MWYNVLHRDPSSIWNIQYSGEFWTPSIMRKGHNFAWLFVAITFSVMAATNVFIYWVVRLGLQYLICRVMSYLFGHEVWSLHRDVMFGRGGGKGKLRQGDIKCNFIWKKKHFDNQNTSTCSEENHKHIYGKYSTKYPYNMFYSFKAWSEV